MLEPDPFSAVEDTDDKYQCNKTHLNIFNL